ncbi:NUDIX domain-containing protein [Halovulum dunhuangense]|uniref:ADP-ribose pyrophosphatase n=1 Tax=Halovulum dunhuangense TaxID=1505036 RepID=A0A849L194_9RHOB|nr:NUDIX domain-containing protein [Halovulum dunhuangense]NNU80056.1 NUDIX domain-containing protein [Halovulum dunhuangense]
MSTPIFVYGTLRDPDVLALALGPLTCRLAPVSAHLPDHIALRAAGGPFPALRPRKGARAEGLLLAPMDDEIRDALDVFEGAFAFSLVPMRVVTHDGPVEALVFEPAGTVADTGQPWLLEDWQRDDKPLMLAMSREAVLGAGMPGGMLRRAIARVNATAEGQGPRHLRSDFGPGAIADHRVARLSTGFFALEEHHFRHRLHAGGHSESVRREVFVTGDAVTVLPWDPKRDLVLLIEQVRAGLLGRGDPNPWNIEVIAGLIDTRETPEETARREAMEEAGLTLGRIERIAGYYASPGAVSEYLTSFVAEADLGSHAAGLHGLDGEHEDIRTLILPREEAMQAIASGEARNAPLLLSLMGLERLRPTLGPRWTGAVAGGACAD